jgi:hypothetical protein
MTLGLAEDPVASQTWRDPFVFRDPGGDGWHMFITARLKGAPRPDDGVIGHARSVDMVRWELGPPLSRPAGFGQIEVPQARMVQGRPTLVFTCHTDEQTDWPKEQSDLYCTLLHLVGARRFSGRALRYQRGRALCRRAGPFRGAVRAGPRRELGAGGICESGTQGHQFEEDFARAASEKSKKSNPAEGKRAFWPRFTRSDLTSS